MVLIALFAASQAAAAYVSQYNYVNEIREYYKKEIRLQLAAGKYAANEPEQGRPKEEEKSVEDGTVGQDPWREEVHTDAIPVDDELEKDREQPD